MYLGPPSEKARALNLTDGEWQIFCPQCEFKGEKNTAMKATCPDCDAQLHIASEKANPAPSSASTIHVELPPHRPDDVTNTQMVVDGLRGANMQ